MIPVKILFVNHDPADVICKLKMGRCYDRDNCDGEKVCDLNHYCINYVDPCEEITCNLDSYCHALSVSEAICTCFEGYHDKYQKGYCIQKKVESNCHDNACVPAGWFMMGCQEYSCDEDNAIFHPVYLDRYEIDQYEVTVEQYYNCVKSGVCRLGIHFPFNYGSNYWRAVYRYEDEYWKHPMDGISYEGALIYCEFMGKSLPTEVQWEKAARGVDARIYPWGDGDE